MSTTTMRRRVAALAAGALGAGALAFVAPAPAAQAATSTPSPGSTLTWQVSKYFDTGFSLKTHEVADGATEAEDGVVTFHDGAGSYDPATGVASVTYQGSVAAVFSLGDYTITIADPAVVTDGAGRGTLTAVVSSRVGTATSGGTRVKVAGFNAGAWTNAALTATPDWLGVLQPGSAEATALGITGNTSGATPKPKPVDGGSFAPEFLGNLDAGLRSHFYASGSSSDADKPPAAFTAQLPRTVTSAVDASQSSFAKGLAVTVTGTGFVAGTGGLNDAGVYVGIAESGGLPDVSSQESQSQFAQSAFVPSASITANAFTKALTVPTNKLDKTKSYSIYTWQAHTHNTTAQDTETPLVFNRALLSQPTAPIVKKAPVLTPKPAAKLKAGKKALITYNLGATATGKVKVVIKKGKRGLNATLTLKNGRGALAITKAQTKKLGKGTWTITSTYAGNATVKAGKTITKLKVK